jgi:peptidoglycan/xylan/chitin deacetylase (PgdA/CDA1 family)
MSVNGARRVTVRKPADGGLASVSLDLDNQWAYMRTHGDPGWEEYPSYFELVLPLVLAVLQRLDMSITVFVVGKDADLHGHRDLLRQLVKEGHEIGNHSYMHEQWLHQYSPGEIHSDLERAHSAIAEATGTTPVGFRGPGFTWSTAVLKALGGLGYRYDASSLATYLGPVARAYYFRRARLSGLEREQRRRLFGTFGEVFRRNRPYEWKLADGGRLLEIPVTTVPVLRIPWHMSYLIYLAQYSERVAMFYLETALALCRLTRTEPSFLLHPLDFLGGDELQALNFFPGMGLPGAKKRELTARVLARLAADYRLVTLATHADAILAGGAVPRRALG